jgi:hypothetical protein
VLAAHLRVRLPQGRLHRPQTLLLRFCLRHSIPTLVYRLDTRKARTRGARLERERFQAALDRLPEGGGGRG